MRNLVLAALLTAPLAAPPAIAQSAVQQIAGTRLDVVATGEVTRTPDIAQVSTGVVTEAPTANAAMAENARRMAAVRTALTRAGVADRDVQTSALSLAPNYRYANDQPPVLIGYRASNDVTVRFRDMARAGAILDALVAQGANQINGPVLTIEHPETALDEARVKALAAARARADLYARQLGLRVARVISVNEGGIEVPAPPMPMARGLVAAQATKIDPGEQSLGVTLAVSFELQ